MKPYKNLESYNLSILHLVARFTAVLGILILLIAIIATLLMLPGGIAGIVGAIVFIPMAIGILLLSGLMAVLVSFEENYRIRTVALTNANET
jgi:hypothetical protein